MDVTGIAAGVSMVRDFAELVKPLITEWWCSRRDKIAEEKAAAAFNAIVNNLGVGSRQLLCNAYHNGDKFDAIEDDPDLLILADAGLVRVGGYDHMGGAQYSLTPIMIALMRHEEDLDWFTEDEHQKAREAIAKRRAECSGSASDVGGEWWDN